MKIEDKAMQRIIMIIIAIAAIFSVKAQYQLIESKGSVQVESKEGTKKRVVPGMQLKGNDIMILGFGAEAKILNKMRKETYTTETAGKATVVKRMVESRRIAASKSEVIRKFSSAGIKTESKGKVYAREGAVNRGGLEIGEDSCTVNISDIRLIAAMLRNWKHYEKYGEEFLPVTINYVADKENCQLSISNQGEVCYYFNVFRIDSGNEVSVETYAIGDPCLNNRVENCAEWTMECKTALPEGSHRVVVLSDTPYDIEEVLLELCNENAGYDDAEAVSRNKQLVVLRQR